ncbi:hypothetical protein WS67_20425 [Burkholderia singularis]|uniref:Ketoreductase domain-containing protein n=1 Tax=Burkholderia singularis TaxID=1503053 RepID=A0A103DXE0_9BURK|nr:hypothetical protein AQ611_20075 [Burkholderia sp. Bp7605]KVE24477.1 hypothetical protein WS67_20425 [Burkholderia singularis]
MIGKVAIVTGSSSGIGLAVARSFAEHGAHLVLVARRHDRLVALTRQLAHLDVKVVAIAADITQEESRQAIISQAMRNFGRIDILVNNAGFGYRSPIEATPLSAIRSNFETNVFSPIALAQLVIPIMKQQRSGCIVNMSSVAGKIARPLSSIYDATKHALEAISDGLRGELKQFGIRVLVIEPGFVQTEFTDIAKTISSEYYGKYPEYQTLLQVHVRRDERWRRFAADADEVARTIVQAVQGTDSKVRYVTPGFARLMLTLKRILPERLFHRLIDV